MESTNHSRVLKLIQEMAKTSEITGDEKDQLKGGTTHYISKIKDGFRETHE